jgi:DNA-binding transcriptional ArsR family regulator
MQKHRLRKGTASAALLFAALGDETRLALVQRVAAGGPASITELSERFSVSRQAVTKHLRFLAKAGLMKSRREGRECIWELKADRLAGAHRWLDRISRGWDSALGRLKAHVERGA